MTNDHTLREIRDQLEALNATLKQIAVALDKIAVNTAEPTVTGIAVVPGNPTTH